MNKSFNFSLLLIIYILFAGYRPVSLFHHVVADDPQLDTNTIIYDYRTKEPFRYYQYIRMLISGKYGITSIHTTEGVRYTDDKYYLIMLPPDMPIPDSLSAVVILKRIFSKPTVMPLKGIDTTIVVYSEQDVPLRYFQYTGLVRTGRYRIHLSKGKRSLIQIPDGRQIDEVSMNNNIYYSLTKADRILVKKSVRKMYIQRAGKTLFEFPVNLGKNPTGHKQQEGDGRTPEGIYYLTDAANYEASYYRGHVISYPNEKDIANARKRGVSPGGEVMIHGTNPKKSKLKDWTNGCIAISNAHIDTLEKYMSPEMPIEIRP